MYCITLIGLTEKSKQKQTSCKCSLLFPYFATLILCQKAHVRGKKKSWKRDLKVSALRPLFDNNICGYAS